MRELLLNLKSISGWIKPFEKREFLIGIFIFIFFFLLVMVSRQLRLDSATAIRPLPDTHLFLENDLDTDGLIKLLTNEKVDFDSSDLQWASKLLGWRNFKTGHYLLSKNYSFEDLFSKLALGIQDPIRVTILPGITPERFASNLAIQLKIDSLSIADQLHDSLYLANKGLSREELFGRMLPDSYDLYWTTNAEALLNRVLAEFNREVTQPFEARAKELGYSVDEIVTMASIVEWEVTKADEKPIISGLYWNRINRKMPLQADPTVNFSIGERRRLLFEDYRFEHPFNTYLYAGLPPGPITNPALSTIKAALYPQTHDYLYMVANPEGGHVFTKTFKEHTAESEKWRRWLQEQYRIKRQIEADGASAESASLPN